MKTRAALLTRVGEPWIVDDIELGELEPHDVIMEIKVAGLCHSDEHMSTGDMVIPEKARIAMGMPSQFPIVGGHEGAGVVEEDVQVERAFVDAIDLFVADAARGKGLGRALIEAVYEKAGAASASRVYWLTQSGNAQARALYDKMADNLGFIQYRKVL